jgi:hypothetical protein
MLSLETKVFDARRMTAGAKRISSRIPLAISKVCDALTRLNRGSVNPESYAWKDTTKSFSLMQQRFQKQGSSSI